MHEKTVSRKTVYEGRILDLEVQEVELENGRRAVREIVRHGGAVAVLARLPDGKFAFVRQFRKPVEKDMLEVVAGNREPAEDPEACARRELMEETGLEAGEVRHLGFIYPSPGYGDERIDIYSAEAVAGSRQANPDEDEHLDVVLLDRDEIVERMRQNEIQDSKTLAAWLLYEKIVEQPVQRREVRR
ncbi:MAG: NUDIX hydrolase [Verrucomicrobiota bacterium]